MPVWDFDDAKCRTGSSWRLLDLPERRAPDSRVLAAAVEHDVAEVQNVPRRMREVEAWR
ncbi:MAG: hypothetical protein LBJ87_06395 [bacterium]|jgi:hypothetical protein|nr:hypothetical protein [bacterium]